MPYINLFGQSDLLRSNLNDVGIDIVDQFDRKWTATEVDTYNFSVIAPTTPIQMGQLYELWADPRKQYKLGTVYVQAPGLQTYAHHPYAANGQEIVIYNVLGVGPTALLKRKRINFSKDNINISQLAKEIVTKGAVEFGITTDFSFIDYVDITLNTRYVDMTVYDIMERLRPLGITYYVDDDLNFHFSEDKGDVLGYAMDDKTSYLNTYTLSPDISELRNAVKIVGADKVKQAPDYTITGTGDLTTGLDFNLPHNVKFVDDLLLEGWNGITVSTWLVSDPKQSTSTLSPDGSQILSGNSSVRFQGGSGLQGATYIQRAQESQRQAGNALVQTLSLYGLGNGFILAYGDGNGALESNLAGFYIDPTGSLTVKEYGTGHAPGSPIILKRSFSTDDNITVTGVSIDRNQFSVPTGFGQYFSNGDVLNLVGDGIGIFQATVSGVTGDSLTVTQPIPAGSLDDVKLTRIAIYKLVIQMQAAGFIYKIQGEQYGQLNSGIYTTVLTTSGDTTLYLFPVVGAPKDPGLVFEVEDTFINPSGGVTFTRGSEVLLCAPEDQGSGFDFPVLIRPADAAKNPPLFRYRPQRFIATVSDGTATTTSIPVSSSDFDQIFLGDRLLINKHETFVTGFIQGSDVIPLADFYIEVSPALPSAPAEDMQIFVGTTAAALGQNGVLQYSYPVSNRRFFRDPISIAAYGLIEDQPIIDQTLKTSDDMQARFDAFKETKGQPKIVGNISFEFSPALEGQ